MFIKDRATRWHQPLRVAGNILGQVGRVRYFAEGAGDGDNGSGATGGAGDATKQNAQGAADGTKKADGTEITIPTTKEDLEKLLQSETDKKVSKALETAKKNWEKDFEQKMKDAQAEAEKMAKMSAEEKEKAILEKAKKELEIKEQEIKRKGLELSLTDELVSKNLPVEFKTFLMADSEETIKEKLQSFQKLWDSALAKAVDERLQGGNPRKGNTKQDGSGSASLSIGKKLAEMNKGTSKQEVNYFK